MIILFAVAVVFTLLNLHIGRSMVKRHGKWQFGLMNWVAALYLASVTIELAVEIF